MTTNKNYNKYNALVEKTRELKAQQRALEIEQNELVLTKIKSLQEIGRSVFRKCCPGQRAEAESILGNLSWIFDELKIKELTDYSITAAKVSYRSRDWTLEEVGTVELKRVYLHMSDRDFAKLVRQKIRSWKELQRAEDERKAEAELKAARTAAKSAETKLRNLEARLAKRTKPAS